MSLKAKVLKGSALLGATRIVQRLLAFGRNVFVARLLLPEDFGLAATFWITTAFLNTLTDLGLQQWMIQSKDGDSEEAGAVVQSLFLIRGSLIAAVLFVSAGPIAWIFDAEEAIWAFQVVALLPFIQGFQHRDLDRVKRQLSFGPSVTAALVPEAVITIAAIPLALILRDYRVFVYTALINVSLTVFLSHWLAERPYRIGWNVRFLKQAIAFGWPLLINSLLIYATMQGDRILLAKFYTKAELGVYSVAIGLVTSLVGVVIVSVNPIVLPLMSGVQEDRSKFERYFQLHMSIVCGAALFLGLSFIILGPRAITTIYGSNYALAGVVIGWLGIAECLRLLRGPAMNAAMAVGDTRNTMYTNVARQFGIILALLVAVRGLSIGWIATCCVLGEVAALVVTGILLKLRHSISLRSMLLSSGLTCFAFSIAVASKWLLPLHDDWRLDTLHFVILSIATFTAYVCLFPNVKKLCTEVLKYALQPRNSRQFLTEVSPAQDEDLTRARLNEPELESGLQSTFPHTMNVAKDVTR